MVNILMVKPNFLDIPNIKLITKLSKLNMIK